jgi:hypothetical protein
MSYLWVPNYVTVKQFDDKSVQWTAPAVAMTPIKVGVPSGEHTFVIDVKEVSSAGLRAASDKSYTHNFEAGKGYQLLNRSGEIQLINL